MQSKKNKDTLLPVEFKKYFWDVNFSDLTMEKYPRFITERILNFGDLNGIKWLFSQTDLNFINTVTKNSRNLNAKTKNYWKLILD